MRLLIIFLLITLKMGELQAPLYENFWIVWNIGQGQWVTHVTSDACFHYDAGGEPGSFKRIRAKLVINCGRKRNELFLSHWDMDHFLHIPNLAKTVPRLCWKFKPTYGVTKASAKKILQLNLKNCSATPVAPLWLPSISRTTNESSAVFFSDRVLLPGDSPTTQEKLWAHNRSELLATKVLILGHHGSRSSTGTDLLNQLPNLIVAVASSRWVKYRHPHPQTLMRLYEKEIPVLRTEDWGNIILRTQF
jgi:competence protein ComEC